MTSELEHKLRDGGLRVTRPRLAVLRALHLIQPAGSVARYEARVGDNHHHLVCRTCGDIQDVDCALSAAPCLTASDDAGFEIDEAEVVYWGRCPTCSDITARTHHREAPRE